MPYKVLIVEDNDIHGKMVVDLLETKGYEVRWAQNGANAFEILDVFLPDVILMDMQLPDLSGEEITTRIKAKKAFAAIPIIAVTAFASKDDEATMRQAGCSDFISKPFDFKKFFENY